MGRFRVTLRLVPHRNSPGQQALRVELLPSGERTPEQLWRVPGGSRHLSGAAECGRPDTAGADDGPGGRSAQSAGQEELEAQLQPVPEAPAAVLTVRVRWFCFLETVL